jgi:bifunctional non-homologous end joining protein LigD
LTSLEKILFPAARITKGDVLDYYRSIAPTLLPHLKHRPITLERLPDGLRDGAPHFWQKNTPSYYPNWIPRVTLKTEANKPVAYALINDVRSLLYLANQGTVTFHSYFSTTGCLSCPDFVLFDLDVSEGTFAHVVTIAKQLRRQLDAAGVPSYPKTSGKRGLHVLTPWSRQQGGYDEARAWATAVAKEACRALPDIATTERLKDARGNRVYVDVVQNALGHHAVPPYVVRATPTATVSTPLEWGEVNGKLDPKRFTMKATLERVKKKGDLMADLVTR